MGAVTNFFQRAEEKWQRNRIANAAFKHLKAAIHSNDLIAVRALSNDPVSFQPDQIRDLLVAAVETNSVDIFNTVLEKCAAGDANFKLEYSGGCTVTQSSLLSVAIDIGSENIALALAKNPATDIKFTGCICSTDGQENDPSPLDAARKKNMPEVVKVLAKRTATALRAEANSLEAGAAKPSKI